MAKNAVQQHKISIKLACRCFNISESSYYYRSKFDTENTLIAEKLVELTTRHKAWGFKLCFLHLRNVQGYSWNHKRVYRIYRELELNLRIKPRKRLKRDKPHIPTHLTSVNQVWSMDFMSDGLATGQAIRTFNVVDNYSREGLALDVDLSMPSSRVIRSLDQIIEWRGKPASIICDNGPEYVSEKLVNWANRQGITLIYTQPGKPTQNAFIERFNRTVRNEYLNMTSYNSLQEAQCGATEWLWTYNNDRPHMAIGGITPKMFLNVA